MKTDCKMLFGAVLLILSLAAIAAAGPYTEPGIYKNDIGVDSEFWAVDCEVIRGFVKITDPNQGYASFGSKSNAEGPADGTSFGVVSLGDGGIATLTFDESIYITNDDGNDFAVFENGFVTDGGSGFLELAFVEVSSDGVNFFGFDAVSLTPTNVQADNATGLDPTNIHNLAGKHLMGYGTQFDLEELKDVNDLLDVNSVTHIRIIDVVGFVEPADFYGEGIVNFIDFGIFAGAYGSENGESNWNEDCDIYREWIPEVTGPPLIPAHYDDPNGQIELYDFQVLTGKWLDENDYSSCDINGHQINDPWPTDFDSSGFDLDAVGVINKRDR